MLCVVRRGLAESDEHDVQRAVIQSKTKKGATHHMHYILVVGSSHLVQH